jgi:ABC-type polysaccharide transport system permease subunit
VLTFGYMDTGNYQLAAAVTLAQTLIMVILVIITRAVFKVRLEGAVSRA